MLNGFDGMGQGVYKKWKNAAQRLRDVLTAYASISGTATASTAMEIAVKELDTGLQNKRACWDAFDNYCIDKNTDPDQADSDLSMINVTSRARILELSMQADSARHNLAVPGNGPTACASKDASNLVAKV